MVTRPNGLLIDLDALFLQHVLNHEDGTTGEHGRPKDHRLAEEVFGKVLQVLLEGRIKLELV